MAIDDLAASGTAPEDTPVFVMQDISQLITPEDPRTHRQRMADGDWFWGPDTELLELQGRSTALVERYAVELKNGIFPAITLLSELFGTCDFSYVKPPFTVEYGFNVHLDKTFINSGAVLLDAAPIVVGAGTVIGPSVQLLTSSHPIDVTLRRRQIVRGRPITIGSDVWIGGGAIVLGGVTIGDRSVIGAGSVVTRDVPADVVAAGNPARVIRSIDNGDAVDAPELVLD